MRKYMYVLYVRIGNLRNDRQLIIQQKKKSENHLYKFLNCSYNSWNRLYIFLFCCKTKHEIICTMFEINCLYSSFRKSVKPYMSVIHQHQNIVMEDTHNYHFHRYRSKYWRCIILMLYVRNTMILHKFQR